MLSGHAEVGFLKNLIMTFRIQIDQGALPWLSLNALLQLFQHSGEDWIGKGIIGIKVIIVVIVAESVGVRLESSASAAKLFEILIGDFDQLLVIIVTFNPAEGKAGHIVHRFPLAAADIQNRVVLRD